jgi:hypothetical protein
MTAMKLQLAPGFSLPEEAVTQTFGILAKRGAGKSNAAAVMAEEMFKAGLPFVVVDPVGAWWGLRSSSDGKGPGLEIPIFGGHRGDVPLERGGAELVADLVIDESFSCVVDVSAFESETGKREFLATFAERLFRRKGQPGRDAPLHLFLEEADDYAPQRATGQVARCLGAFQRIVKQGRARGLGATMISQRSAALNKDLLTQIETLIVLRTTGPHDIKAIADWVKYHGQAEELLASLHELAPGEAWVWSPWLDLTKRIQIRRRKTFDSGATPKLAAKKAPTTLADVDLDVLRKRMADTIERAKADDPKELRKQVRLLQIELAKHPTETKVETVTERVEVPMLTVIERDHLERVIKASDQVRDAMDAVLPVVQGILGRRPEMERSAPTPRLTVQRAPRAVVTRERVPSGEDAPLRRGERKMLEILARHHPMRVTRAQLATLSGFTASGGTFGTYFGTIKRQGFIEEQSGIVEITEAGLDYVGVVPAVPMSTEEVIQTWRQALRAGERSMLDVLVAAYPNAVTRDDLAEQTGFTVSGGTFGTYLGTLRRNGLAETNGGDVRAGNALFLEG